MLDKKLVSVYISKSEDNLLREMAHIKNISIHEQNKIIKEDNVFNILAELPLIPEIRKYSVSDIIADIVKDSLEEWKKDPTKLEETINRFKNKMPL